MSSLITDNPEKAYKLLYKTLDRLIANRIADGAFTDEEDVKDRKYFSTLEGLESLLIPFVTLPKNLFWEPLKEKYPKLKSIIIDDINFILDFNKNESFPPQEHGYPYFVGAHYRKSEPIWTSECSSFTLSVLANFLELRRKYNIGQNISKRTIEKVILTNYNWVKNCKRDKTGWAWTHQTSEHPWPTWSLLDTFEELVTYRSTNKIISDLGDECKEVVKHIVGKFNNDFSNLWNDKVGKNISYDIITALNLCRLMLVISLYEHHSVTYPLSTMLYSWASETDFPNVNYQYNLSGAINCNIVDSSLVPTTFRTLCTMAGALKPKNIDNLDEEINQDHEVVLNRVFSKLNNSLITHGKYKDLWGIPDGTGTTYELYFTERTIEALTIFLNLYKKDIKLDREVAPVKKSGVKGGKAKKTSASASKKDIPNDIDKYTTWIPQLAKQVLPDELKMCSGWEIDELLEFYVFRLFNVTFALDGNEWGHKRRFQKLPDGRIFIPNSNKTFLYDAKSSAGMYSISASELDKFVRYATEGRKKESVVSKEIQFFVVIAPDFKGDLKEKAAEFLERANLKLVCMRAKNICSFADKVRQKTTNPSQLQHIKWSRLLSYGDPLIGSSDFEKTRDIWIKELEDL
jgi:hypothetical protein